MSDPRGRLVRKLCRGDASLERLLDHLTDLRRPATWYPETRKAHPLGRQLVCHVGPTNSGKTYAALEAFRAAAPASIYCGPLRLLAVETWERVTEGLAGEDVRNSTAIECSLRTGEIRVDRRRRPQNVKNEDIGAKNLPANDLAIACTTEMAPLGRPYRVAIIDEYQLMSDERRGGAFTQAILGINAETIHLCGEPAGLELLKALAADAGDRPLERRQYERLGGQPLRVVASLASDLGRIRPGDCVIAFSKREIFELKRRIEQSSRGGLRCAVVYGSLPLESRSEQANRFNNHQTSGFPVLVASDAVGMGLNLNISRIIFSSMTKFDGLELSSVPTALVRQIAGRAGRFGSDYPEGQVTTLHAADLPYLQACLDETPQVYTRAGLFPPPRHIEQFARLFPNRSGAASMPLATILEAFMQCHQCDPHYFLTDLQTHLFLANRLGQYEEQLSITDTFTLASSPIKINDEDLLASFDYYANRLARGQQAQVRINLKLHQQHHPEDALAMAETVYRTLDLYLWLSLRFPHAFPQGQQALQRRQECGQAVERALGQLTLSPSNRKKTIASAVKERLGLSHVAEVKEKATAGLFEPKQMIGLDEIDSIIEKLDSAVKSGKDRRR